MERALGIVAVRWKTIREVPENARRGVGLAGNFLAPLQVVHNELPTASIDFLGNKWNSQLFCDGFNDSVGLIRS